MKACVLCTLLVCASASVVRERRDFSGGGIGISSGYGAAYATYGDYSGYGSRSAPLSWSRSPSPAYIYSPVSQEVINEPKVVQQVLMSQVNLKKIPVNSPGYSGYGTGTTSGYYGYSSLFGHSGFSASAFPRYSGYANGWL